MVVFLPVRILPRGVRLLLRNPLLSSHSFAWWASVGPIFHDLALINTSSRLTFHFLCPLPPAAFICRLSYYLFGSKTLT